MRVGTLTTRARLGYLKRSWMPVSMLSRLATASSCCSAVRYDSELSNTPSPIAVMRRPSPSLVTHPLDVSGRLLDVLTEAGEVPHVEASAVPGLRRVGVRSRNGRSVMRIAVMGSGGVGGYFGGLLARAGEDVTFIARGAHLEALRAHGLTVQSRISGDFTRAVSVTNDPEAIGAVDLVLLGVKTYDLDAAASRLPPLIGSQTVVLPLQNGIDASERLVQILGASPVLGGVTYVIATRTSPGVIVHLGLNRIILGEYPSGTSARTERVREVLQRAGVTAEVHPDIRVPLWEKLVALAASGGAMAATRLPIGSIRDCPETSALLRAVIDEAVAVGRAAGIPLPADCVERHWATLQGLDRSARGSMSHDLLAGRRLEVEALNGAVVRAGRQAGVPTPLNFAVYAALKPYAEGAPSS